MKILPAQFNQESESPLRLKLSFEAVYEHIENISKNPDHVIHEAAEGLLNEMNQYPILREGFEDFSDLKKYNTQIDKLLDILFPELLTTNEIKAASIPFQFTTFKFSKRFKEIIDNAGEDYDFKLKNFEDSNMYIMTCTFIMAFVYNFKIDFQRPFYFEIPNVKTGFTRHYRALFNGDFFKVAPLKNAPKLTEEDLHELIDNYDNIDLWKEKFPPNSYEFKGFGLMNLVDVTSDQIISTIKEKLLKKDQESVDEVENNVSYLFGSKNIQFEFSTYAIEHDKLVYKQTNKQRKFKMFEETKDKCEGHFCDRIVERVFKDREIVAISDIEKYAERSGNNGFSKLMLEQGIKSIIFAPIDLRDDLFGVMELVSPNKYELNSVNVEKLKDIIPIFKLAAQRYMEEMDDRMESIIQQYYTAIHPSVKWKFYEAAEEFAFENDTEISSATLKDILFEDVVPLYGQSDIKGSSKARNSAIQKDLVFQLNLASNIMNKAMESYQLPIYGDLQFRIDEYKNSIAKELDSGDEMTLSYFLKQEIYPVFNHLKTLSSELNKEVENYMLHIDPKLHVVYNERKKYEESVNFLNEKMTDFIDKKQIEAQHMFPHYFERYKTDGVDYNMYIGQSLLKTKKYDKIYLDNLRLWQLQMMCELENIVFNLKDDLTHPLQIASLILVHSTPLTIKFRMDEKRFDVDGAYNIRYEILKKRIDKAHIKNTSERLTQPGKIAIVYSQDQEADEYLKYIKHLQAKGLLTKNIERLEIEDLQGTTGLRALRVEINYSEIKDSKITLNDLMDVIQSKN
ncbi:MAG: GAF domain-containing protein [Bacteroidetes bacterium MedPE-SWsnd-G1]|nr:MAG: GAF domain-containing protein [Bacteroidetes bacterium MedPE-SWsnd-G1]